MSPTCSCLRPQIVVHAVRRAVDELGTASWADPQAVLTAQTLRWDGGARAVDIGSHNLVLHAAGKWGFRRSRGNGCSRPYVTLVYESCVLVAAGVPLWACGTFYSVHAGCHQSNLREPLTVHLAHHGRLVRK